MGATPEGMGYHILLSVKMTLNARIKYVLVHFYITTLTLLYSLRLQGGSYSPPSPPKSATDGMVTAWLHDDGSNTGT